MLHKERDTLDKTQGYCTIAIVRSCWKIIFIATAAWLYLLYSTHPSMHVNKERTKQKISVEMEMRILCIRIFESKRAQRTYGQRTKEKKSFWRFCLFRQPTEHVLILYFRKSEKMSCWAWSAERKLACAWADDMAWLWSASYCLSINLPKGRTVEGKTKKNKEKKRKKRQLCFHLSDTLYFVVKRRIARELRNTAHPGNLYFDTHSDDSIMNHDFLALCTDCLCFCWRVNIFNCCFLFRVLWATMKWINYL